MCCGHDNHPPRQRPPQPQTAPARPARPPAVNQVIANQQRQLALQKPVPQRPTTQQLAGRPRPQRQYFYNGSR